MPRGKRRSTAEMGPAEEDRPSKRQRNSFHRYVIYILFSVFIIKINYITFVSLLRSTHRLIHFE